MAKEHILFDKTEIIVMASDGRGAQLINLQYSDITSIAINACEEKKLFSSKPSEKISIANRKTPQPITLMKSKEEAFWSKYKEGLAKFAKDNKVSFQDNTKAD